MTQKFFKKVTWGGEGELEHLQLVFLKRSKCSDDCKMTQTRQNNDSVEMHLVGKPTKDFCER